jgi:CheY-like chemotaxis protein
MARVLIVEDDMTYCKALAASLRDDGHAVLCAADADEAIHFLRSATPDLAIIDMMLPRGNGKDVIAAARTIPTPAYVPIVVLTAGTLPVLEDELLPFVQAWFTKTTVSLREIKQAINDNLLPGQSKGPSRDWPCNCNGRC